MTGRSTFASAIALVVAGSLSSVSVQAQDIGPIVDPGLMGVAAANAQALQRTAPRMAPRFAAARSAPRPRAGPSTAQVVVRTSYRPEAAVRTRVYARAVSAMQKANPGAVAEFRQTLVSGKMRNEAARYLASNGMSANNVVDTTTLYLAAAWLAAHGNNGAPSAAQLKGLRAQVASIYATMPGVLGASNAVKQEIGEANILQASLSSAAAERAARDPRSAAAMRAAVVQGVKTSYQLDLSRMNLTARGLR